MDKKWIEILKFIQENRDRRNCCYLEDLDKNNFNMGVIKTMIEQNLINNIHSPYLTLEGSKILREHLLIESNQKKNKYSEKIIFDSNVFDDMVSGKLEIDKLINFKEKTESEFYISHIQNDEIQSCRDEEKRKKLSLFMHKLRPILIATETFVFDISRFGEAKLGNGDIYSKIKGENIKHLEDALIGEVAIKNNFLLITNDRRLKAKVEELGGKCLFVEGFIKKMEVLE